MKHLTIIYRDQLGGIASKVDARYGISFCDGIVYFTTEDGEDHEIPAEMLSEIQLAEW